MKAPWLKIAFYGLPALVLTLSILFFNSAGFLKRPLTGTDDVPKTMEAVAEYALTDRWDEANRSVTDLLRAWEQVKRRIALIEPKELVGEIDLELAEMRAAVEAEDADQVRMKQRRLEVLWEDLGG